MVTELMQVHEEARRDGYKQRKQALVNWLTKQSGRTDCWCDYLTWALGRAIDFELLIAPSLTSQNIATPADYRARLEEVWCRRFATALPVDIGISDERLKKRLKIESSVRSSYVAILCTVELTGRIKSPMVLNDSCVGGRDTHGSLQRWDFATCSLLDFLVALEARSDLLPKIQSIPGEQLMETCPRRALSLVTIGARVAYIT